MAAMDVAMLSVLKPVLVIVAAGLVPITLVITTYYFRHKKAELEVARDLRKHEIDRGVDALDLRLRAVEAAVHHLAAASPLLVAPPDREQAGQQPLQGAPASIGLPASRLPQP